MIIDAIVKRMGYTQGQERLRLTDQGNLGVDLGQPFLAELAKKGVRFNAVIGNGATFLGPVAAWPTTTLTMALWNGEPPAGKTYFIDSAYVFLASVTTGVAGGALLGCVTTVNQARPTLVTTTPGSNGSYAGVVISGLSGKRPGATNASFLNAITATGDTPAWFVITGGDAAGTATTIAAHAEIGYLRGGVAVPPGYMFGLTYLSGAGSAPLYGFGVTWDELQVNLE